MNDDAPSTLSDEQWIVTIVLRICSASLSILGSGTLAFKIMRDRTESAGSMTPYNRMLLGLSACDIFWSIYLPMAQLFIFLDVFGNATTCQILGSLAQLSFCAVWYNGMLSWFFLLTVLSKVRKQNYVQKAEPWLHISVAWWPITAIVGIFLGLFGEVSSGCYFVDERFFLIFFGPTYFAALSIIINYPAIYFIARKSLRSAEHVAGSELVPNRIEKETMTLMFLYVLGFVICVIPNNVLAQLEGLGYSRYDSKLYPLHVLDAIFVPLQGLFNFFIYIKPVYSRFRLSYPDKSMCFVLKQSVLKSKAPPLHHRRIANRMTYHSDNLITDVSLLSNRAMDPNEALFYPGALQSTSLRDSSVPQLDDASNQPDRNNLNGEG